jgi:hypothetical protein
MPKRSFNTCFYLAGRASSRVKSCSTSSTLINS